MSQTKGYLALTAVTMLLLAGCSGASRQAGFLVVQEQVNERLGYPVHWNQSVPEDEQAVAAIRDLLQQPLTADGAVQIALLNNRRLQASYEALGIAQADVVQAGLLSNPVFHGSATLPFSEGDGADSSSSGGTYTVEVEMNFLSMLYAPKRRALAKSAVEAAQLRVTAMVLDLAGETRLAFYRVQATQQHLEMLRQVVLATEAAVEFAKRLHQAGNIPELDLFIQKAFHDQRRLELAAAETALAESRERLTTLMGLWGADTNRTIEERLPDVPDQEISLEDVEKQAIANSIDLALVQQEIVSLGQQIGIARATSLVPELDLGIEAERTSGEWEVGPALGFTLPFFDRNQAQRAAASAMLHQKQQEYYALAVEIRSAVRAARDRLLATRRAAQFYRDEVLPLREQILQQTQLQYNAMQLGVFRLLQAKQQEIDAGRGYIQALHDYWVARATMDQILKGRLVSMGLTTSAAPQMTASTTPEEGGH